MILDTDNEFADNVTVAHAAGTVLLGNYIDLSTTADYPGNSDGLYLVVQTGDEIITGGGAGTFFFTLVSDALATLGGATVASCTTHYVSPTYTTGAAGTDARIAANTVLCAIELPRGTYERYLGILYTVVSTATTGGTLNAFLTNDPRAWVALPDAVPTPA